MEMKKLFAFGLFVISASFGISQNGISPQQLIELNRVSGLGLTTDKSKVVYAVSKVDVESNSRSTHFFTVDLISGTKSEVKDVDVLLPDHNVSPNGNFKIVVEDVKLKKVFGTDFYPEMTESNVQIYDQLNYRHWDTWEDGAYSHLFLESINGNKKRTDILGNEPFDCPQKPFGGSEDYIWSPDSKSIVYVCKKKYGTEYAVSTNTDLYKYDIASGTTTNLTASNLGYDTQPSFSSIGTLAWLRMKRDGYESDKNDIVVL